MHKPMSSSERHWRALMARAGFRTFREVGLKAGVTGSYVSFCARGLQPSEDAKRKIAKALGVKPEELWPELGGGLPMKI